MALYNKVAKKRTNSERLAYNLYQKNYRISRIQVSFFPCIPKLINISKA